MNHIVHIHFLHKEQHSSLAPNNARQHFSATFVGHSVINNASVKNMPLMGSKNDTFSVAVLKQEL